MGAGGRETKRDISPSAGSFPQQGQAVAGSQDFCLVSHMGCVHSDTETITYCSQGVQDQEDGIGSGVRTPAQGSAIWKVVVPRGTHIGQGEMEEPNTHGLASHNPCSH